jgi:hypothetical protein
LHPVVLEDGHLNAKCDLGALVVLDEPALVAALVEAQRVAEDRLGPFAAASKQLDLQLARPAGPHQGVLKAQAHDAVVRGNPGT